MYLTWISRIKIVQMYATGVEFKQKFQLASRTSRYKNQVAPPDILLARPSWGQLLKVIY